MPPKKAGANGDSTEGAGFKWEGANDLKLLLLAQGRHVRPEEYEQLSSAFPGTTTGSIRNRLSNLRVKQRDLYESLGWTLPEGAAGHSTRKTPTNKKKTPKKRSADESDTAADMVLETPSKKRKAWAGKVKKEEEEEMLEGASGGESEEAFGSVLRGAFKEEEV